VVGGGPVAARKAASLLAAGAVVTLVAPEVSEPVSRLADGRGADSQLSVEQRRYRTGDVAGHRLVITATGVAEVDADVAAEARATGVMVNAADEPELCTFLLPSVVRSGDVAVAVSTGGVSPYAATWVRRRITALLGEDVSELTRILGAARLAVRTAGVSSEGLDWEGLTESVWALLESGRAADAAEAGRSWADGVIAGSGLEASARGAATR
jgi:precorrin-2 dehydrogenase/sirohydrochlorin ferrochelatase